MLNDTERFTLEVHLGFYIVGYILAALALGGLALYFLLQLPAFRQAVVDPQPLDLIVFVALGLIQATLCVLMYNLALTRWVGRALRVAQPDDVLALLADMFKVERKSPTLARGYRQYFRWLLHRHGR